MMLTVTAHAAPDVEPDQGADNMVVLNRHVSPLSPRLRQAVLLDPKVAEAAARACQMAHRLGLARAEGRPKINASITGSRQLVGRIKKVPTGRTVFDGNRIRQIPPPHYAEEIRRSGGCRCFATI